MRTCWIKVHLILQCCLVKVNRLQGNITCQALNEVLGVRPWHLMPLKQVWLKFTCLLLLQSWADLLDGANYMCMFQAHLESNICCFWNALKYANISYNEENLIFFLIRNPRMALKAKHDFSRGTQWICCMSWEDGRRTGNLPVPFGLSVHQPRQKKQTGGAFVYSSL